MNPSPPLVLKDILGTLRRPPRRILFSGCDSDSGAEDEARGKHFVSDAHYHREVHLIVKGRPLFRVAGKVFRVSPGDAILVNRWQEHGTYNQPNSTDPLVIAVLHGHSPYWWNSAMAFGQAAFQIIQASAIYLQNDISTLFERHMDAALVCPDPEQAIAWIAPVLLAMMGEYRLGLLDLSHHSAADTAQKQNLADRIRAHIRTENGGVHCTLSRLSLELGVSRTALSHIYQETFGRSFHEDIERARRDFVHNALINGRFQKEIATDLGFTATSNYNRWLHNVDCKIDKI